MRTILKVFALVATLAPTFASANERLCEVRRFSSYMIIKQNANTLSKSHSSALSIAENFAQLVKQGFCENNTTPCYLSLSYGDYSVVQNNAAVTLATSDYDLVTTWLIALKHAGACG